MQIPSVRLLLWRPSIGVVRFKSWLPLASALNSCSLPRLPKLCVYLLFLWIYEIIAFADNITAVYTLPFFLHMPLYVVWQRRFWHGCRLSMSPSTFCKSYRCSHRKQRIVIIRSLCFAIIIALPATTPQEFKNSASFALGNFTNCWYLVKINTILTFSHMVGWSWMISKWVDQWLCVHLELSSSPLDHLWADLIYQLSEIVNIVHWYRFIWLKHTYQRRSVQRIDGGALGNCLGSLYLCILPTSCTDSSDHMIGYRYCWGSWLGYDRSL